MKLSVLPVYLRTVAAIYTKRAANLLPVWKGKGYTTFAILGRARTGSTLLHTYLNSHTRILSIDEFLHPANTITFTPDQTLEYLHTTGLKKYSGLIQALGFKLFYEWQGERYTPMWDLFRQDPALKIIHLKRRNHLRSLVSLRIALKNKKWSKGVYEAGESAYSKAVLLSQEECLQHFKAMEEEEKQFDMFFEKQHKIELFYEDLVKNPEKELARVQTFLGVKQHRLETLLSRQNPEALSELVVNFQELEYAFRGTKWHAFFVENG
ncbi:sulfotransferase [Rufibacter tibetensis]|uniref:Sulfotransferase domain-containing protein n=1 Tax=Rufibacter tibetensis TaxID=512763 RepID=A0A0P0CZ22_9BACT|nr:sulfotransferase [Rufibacter tibetensis]ALJ00010.1 hypothetical protein DC20_14780 [Rufibacter tibetensis]